jgi:hypothetical protein
MKTIHTYSAVKAAILFTLVLVLTNSLFAQSGPKKETAAGVSVSNPQAVIAQQGGQWTVAVDPAKNTVRIASSDTDPVAVKLVGGGSARKPFQVRVAAGIPIGGTAGDASLQIPAGKRLVIENISAIGRSQAGSRIEIQLFSFFDNGDGVGDNNDITFHRIALTDQGTFNGVATSSANHKTLIFADEQIGAGHFNIGLEVRLDTPATTSASGQVTLSGYLEDLPATP